MLYYNNNSEQTSAHKTWHMHTKWNETKREKNNNEWEKKKS